MTDNALPLVKPAHRAEAAEWLSWLQDHTDTTWRFGEWNQETWLFTGNPDNDRTVLYRCTVTHCTTLKNTHGICAQCHRDHVASDLPLEEFLATHRPRRRQVTPGRPERRCDVRRQQDQCDKPSYCQGLCLSHYRLWLKHHTRFPGCALDDWATSIATPQRGGARRCLVLGCEHERFCQKELCSYHETKRKREAPQTLPAMWATTQTPYLLAEHFSLWPLSEVLRWEMLFALQQRDKRGRNVDPTVIRALVRNLAAVPQLLRGNQARLAAMVKSQHQLSARAHFNEIYRLVHVGHERMQGIEPKDKEIWDLATVDIASEYGRGGRRINGGTYDFTTITQAWLRNVTLEWARRTDPTGSVIRNTLKAVTLASTALERRAEGGHNPSVLQFDDMDAVMKGIREAKKEDEQLFSSSVRRTFAGLFFQVLEFGRRSGLMDDVPGTFSRHQSHTVPHEPTGDEESAGKAIPESVIVQLDRHLDTLGSFRPYAGWPEEYIRRMMQTVYILTRDTGRRPREICSLKIDCLDSDGGHTLIWDNHKAKRYGRRLPITSEPAQAILDWLPYRSQLETHPHSGQYLFPSRGRVANLPYLLSANFSSELREWVDSIPTINSEVVGKDATPKPFDRTLIYPYAFRHSYAQRHADAGVPVDVLRELMDHRQINTTMGYYRISQKRKREAVNKLRHLVVDRHGQAQPVSSLTAYEMRSVAVPFGNCTEPSNVKAGGRSCPIRFQCSGCGFYRPDPSYLPAIEEHINSLKADRERALAMDVDDHVMRALAEEINGFDQVRSTMKATLDTMAPEERQQIEQASAVLRRARAGQGFPSLPLTVVHRKATAE